MSLPGKKVAYRLYGEDQTALIDLLQNCDKPEVKVGERVLCRDPFDASKRAWVTPSKVEVLHSCVWSDGRINEPLPSLSDIRETVQTSLETLREDHKRSLNPTPYKVAVSEDLYKSLHYLWLENAPIGELS